jgi:hypothetical protein
MIVRFESKRPVDNMEFGYFLRFLLDKRHVIECRIEKDRGLFIAIPSIAIGPHYFSPGQFWDYENAQRFTLEATTEGIDHNLRLLDEFLGYK